MNEVRRLRRVSGEGKDGGLSYLGLWVFVQRSGFDDLNINRKKNITIISIVITIIFEIIQ